MSESATPPVGRGPWLLHPVIDLLIGCGLLALPLGALLLWGTDGATSAVVVAFGALSIVVNGPHYASTIVRAHRHDQRARSVLVLASLAAVVAAIAAHVQPVLLAILFTAYLTWSPWHYATQNHGIGLLMLARSGGPSTSIATRGERRALRFAHIGLALAAIVAVHSGPREPFMLRLGFPLISGVVVAAVTAVGAIVVAAVVLVRLRRRGAPKAGLVATASLLSTSLIWFAVPAALTLQGSLIYAGGAAALLHGAQYLWLNFFVEGRLAAVHGRRFDGLAWGALVVGLGIALFTVVPWVASKAFGYDLIISLLIFQAVANLHHFVVDAFIWKWRDPEVSRPVFSGHELAPARRNEVGNLAAVLATVVVIALVMVGVVDVMQLAGTRGDASDRWRGQAYVLNDNDSRLFVQEAQLAIAANDVDGARAALGKAIELSPWNADAQRALIRLHVVEGRYEEAWARRAALPAGLLDEPTSDVTFADVALRTGRLVEAEALARSAIADLGAVDNGNGVEARRVLGMALLQQNKPGEARPLLRAALDDAEVLLGGGDVVGNGAVLELATALARSEIELQQADPALLLLERVVAGATKADRADVAVEAVLLQAGVFVQREQAREALQHLQRALTIAEEVPDLVDAEHVARAWLDYGGLLARSDAPMRTRFTCALRARGFAEKMKPGAKQDELLKFVNEATAFVEEVVPPPEREVVRKDLAAAAREALSLGYPDDDAPEPIPSALQPE